ncbi:hypothetical protein DFQ28_005716 [Apophysomyces sp. BC1034]|nr:hypothetical protein DFQ30_005699 [Apophysomyces sp. BC1015]KAG0177503.1 hypothetical protein DFQ29_004756 [Apophysomyces sp. BC1021]KAG0187882.1 hypothetical protein DFQ28_005716 [Apophysomyces sp. BC1034]
MVGLTDLPLETVEHIICYLASYDKVSVLCVCKEWNAIFHGQLYRNVIVHSRKKLKKLLRQFKRSESTGHLVRSLKVDVSDLASDEVDQLRQACPNIESLSVDCATSNEAIFLWCEAQSERLTKLSLVAANDYIQFNQVVDVLPRLSRLRSLTLEDIQPQWVMTLYRMDLIHAACPDLEYLRIQIGCGQQPNHSPPSPEEIKSDAAPARALREVSLDFRNAFYHYPEWLHYFGLRYPNLECCRLERGFHKWPRRSQAAAEAYRVFAQNCRKLKAIRWKSVTTLDPLLYDALVEAGTGLEEIDMYEDRAGNMNEDYKIYDWLLVSPLAQKITTLSIGPRPECSHPLEFVQDIAHFRHLTRLKIVDDRSEVLRFDVDDILDNCGHITHLTLENIDLAVEEGENRREHPLAYLALTKADLDTAVLRRFSRRCPGLVKLELDDCTYAATAPLKVQIPMWPQALHTVNLACRNLLGKGTARFFAVTALPDGDREEPDQVEFDSAVTRWFYSTDIISIHDDESFAPKFYSLSNEEILALKDIMNQWPEKTVETTGARLCKEKDHQFRSQVKFRNFVHGYVHLCCRSLRDLYINKKYV